MKFRRLLSTILIFVIVAILFGCAPPAPPSPPPTTPGLNLIIAADGEVLLMRDGWSEFHPTFFGAELHRGDQLQPAADARVVVLCDNLTTWTVPSGSPSGLNNGCPQGLEPALVSAGSRIANTRGDIDPLIPYIISPRATKILNATPILRWNPVPGAQSYTIQLSGTDWQEQAEGTEFKYPGTPALRPGVDYLLIVEADNGKSSRDEDRPNLRFNLLSEEEADRVRADVDRIKVLSLAREAEAFALAQLYASNELFAEAIELLQESILLNPQAANVYVALGKLYQQLGLFREAENSYLEAVRIADSVGDLESATAAKAKLGEVYQALGNKDLAQDWLSQAQAGYESLGDSQGVAEIETQIAE